MAIISWAAQAFGAPVVGIVVLVVLVIAYFLSRNITRRRPKTSERTDDDLRKP